LFDAITDKYITLTLIYTVHYDLTLLEEKVLYRNLKGSISATYLEPLKGSIHS